MLAGHARRFHALALVLLLVSDLAAQASGIGVSVTVYGPLLEPVPNADVTVRLSDWSPIKQGRSDGSGQFLFSGPEGRWVYCCATAPGMCVGCEFTRRLTRESSPVQVDVRLFAAATIRGTVRDEMGKPIPGAEAIHAFDYANLSLLKGETEGVTSDASGAFVLSNVPLGDIAVRASAEGFELGETSVYLRGDATVDVVLKRGKGRELVVVVEGVPAERLPDIQCRMFNSRPYPQPQMTLPPRLARARVDEKGQCVIQGLPREPELSIRLEASGMRFHPQSERVEAGKDGRVTFRLDAITGPRPAPAVAVPAVPEAEPDARPEPAPLVPSRVENPTLRGVLRDEAGKPRGLTRVRLYADRTGWREAVTAEDGTFAVDAKYEAGDNITFELRNPDWVLVDDAPQDWMTTLGTIWRQYERGKVQDLVVTAAAKVRGTVEATRGKSVAGLPVWLEVGGPRQGARREFGGMGTTDAKGEFVIEGLRPPAGEVWFVIRGLCGTAEAGPFKFGADRELKGVELKLQAPLAVTGTIVDGAGKPIPGARLKLAASSAQAEGMLLGGVTLSDTSGRFAFRGMKAGEYVIEARVRGSEVAAKSKSFEISEKKRFIEQQIKVPGK